MEKNKNKIEWQFDRLEGENSIWRGTTPKGAVLYGLKDGDNIIDITLYSAPKTPRVVTNEELRIAEAKESLTKVDSNSMFIMYDIHDVIKTYSNNDWNILDNKEGRLYGWTVVGVITPAGEGTFINFHISICNKKDKFCKKIGVVEALNNNEVYTIHLSNSTHKELNSIFVNTVKDIILPRYYKKFKRRF